MQPCTLGVLVASQQLAEKSCMTHYSGLCSGVDCNGVFRWGRETGLNAGRKEEWGQTAKEQGWGECTETL